MLDSRLDTVKSTVPTPLPRTAPIARAAEAGADLRQRILATAETLLEERGVAGLSLREVARRAGVTHQAPYHHFADREAILAELVARGFTELARRLAEPNAQAAAAGRRATLVASGAAYVGFALDHPGIFRIMFRPELCDPARFPEAQAAGEAAHGELRRMVALVHGAQASDALATGYWSLVHGLACLMVDGPLGQQLSGQRARRAHTIEALSAMVELIPLDDPP